MDNEDQLVKCLDQIDVHLASIRSALFVIGVELAALIVVTIIRAVTA